MADLLPGGVGNVIGLLLEEVLVTNVGGSGGTVLAGLDAVVGFELFFVHHFHLLTGVHIVVGLNGIKKIIRIVSDDEKDLQEPAPSQ